MGEMKSFGIHILETKKSENSKDETVAIYKSIEVDEDYFKAIENLNPGQWCYIYQNVLDWDKLCIILNWFLDRDIVPGLIFSTKYDRDNFFQRFYGSRISGLPTCCNRDGRYTLRSNVSKEAIWNGKSLVRTTLDIDKLPENKKLFIGSKLISHWMTEDIGEENILIKADIIFFVKTASKEKKKGSIAEYFDFEDRYITSSFPKSRCVIFVYDISSLPRPEKIFYSQPKLFTLVSQLDSIQPPLTTELTIGLPKIKIEYRDQNFFDSLEYYEKIKFSQLLTRLVWSKLLTPNEIMVPDDSEKEYFSGKIGRRNEIGEIFWDIQTYLNSYALKNWDVIEEKLIKNQNISVDFDVMPPIRFPNFDKKSLFVPSDKIFSEVFRFVFAKNIFYKELQKFNYSEAKKEIFKLADSFKGAAIKPDRSDESSEEPEYQGKVNMEEQYGEEKFSLIECKKIIFRSDEKSLFMFVPINSKAKVDIVDLSGSKKPGIKYIDLQPGDSFEKNYWDYTKLIEEFRKRPELVKNDKFLEEALEKSSSFRKLLDSYLSSRSSSRVLDDIEADLAEAGTGEKPVTYLTIVSWVDIVMQPLDASLPTISALVRIFNKKAEFLEKSELRYDHTAKEFIDACKYIKNKRKELNENEGEGISEERKITLIVQEIDIGPYKVRGENVGRIYSVT